MKVSQPPAWPEELLCDHLSEGGQVVTHVRGTLLVSSLQILRDGGYFDRYLSQIGEEWRDQVLFTIALSWVPIEVAIAHYAACDALGLTNDELAVVGERVASRLADTFLGTILRTSRSAGLDGPWIALRSQPRIWDRLYVGGGVKVWRVGPKDAVAEFTGLPLVRYHYFRVAFCGYYRGLANLFVHSAHVKPARIRDPRPDTFAITGSWV